MSSDRPSRAARPAHVSRLARLDRFVTRWVGLALSLLGIVSIGWLAATGRLELYIHPRYTWFTVGMAAVAAVGVIAGFAVLARRRGTAGAEADPDDRDVDDADDDGHGHGEHDHPSAASAPTRTALVVVARLAVIAVAAVALLVVPPATLTAATTQNRELSTTAVGIDSGAPSLVGGDTSSFSVKDWSNLLRQGGAEAVTGKQVAVSGFVIEEGSSDDEFFVARLTITCCAVDAQPVGIPVYRPGWRETAQPGEWVEVSGGFRDNPDVASDQPLAVVAEELTAIEEPAQPYVF